MDDKKIKAIADTVEAQQYVYDVVYKKRMNKESLIKIIMDKHGLTKREAKAALKKTLADQRSRIRPHIDFANIFLI